MQISRAGCDHVSLWSDTLPAAAVEPFPNSDLRRLRSVVRRTAVRRRNLLSISSADKRRSHDNSLVFSKSCTAIAFNRLILPAISIDLVALLGTLERLEYAPSDFITDRSSLSLSEDQLICSVS